MNKQTRILVLLSVFLLVSLTACRTISGVYIPETVSSSTASFDQGQQTSGILEELPDGSGYVVTPHFVERYDALVALYGKRFTPELKKGEGLRVLEGGKIGIDNERMVKFLVMNKWRKSGIAP